MRPEVMPMCECTNWARRFKHPHVMWNHHPGCEHFDCDKEAHDILTAFVKGIESWAADEDGVHPVCWDVYVQACRMIGEPVKGKEV